MSFMKGWDLGHKPISEGGGWCNSETVSKGSSRGGAGSWSFLNFCPAVCCCPVEQRSWSQRALSQADDRRCFETYHQSAPEHKHRSELLCCGRDSPSDMWQTALAIPWPTDEWSAPALGTGIILYKIQSNSSSDNLNSSFRKILCLLKFTTHLIKCVGYYT